MPFQINLIVLNCQSQWVDQLLLKAALVLFGQLMVHRQNFIARVWLQPMELLTLGGKNVAFGIDLKSLNANQRVIYANSFDVSKLNFESFEIGYKNEKVNLKVLLLKFGLSSQFIISEFTDEGEECTNKCAIHNGSYYWCWTRCTKRRVLK